MKATIYNISVDPSEIGLACLSGFVAKKIAESYLKINDPMASIVAFSDAQQRPNLYVFSPALLQEIP